MCYTALIPVAIGLATTVASTMYTASQQAGFAADQNKAQKEKEQASALARAAESDRQKTLEDKSNQNFQAELTQQAPQKFQDVANQGTQDALNTTQQVRQEANLDRGVLPGQTGGSVSDVFTKDVARASAERMADANQRIGALARLSGYDRAGGYQSTTSKRYDADQALLSDQAKRSLALGMQEGNTSAPWVGSPSTGLGAAGTAIGNAAIQYGASKGAGDSLSNIFSSNSWKAAPGMEAAGYQLAPGMSGGGSGIFGF